ncbi:MAG: UpxY family transcription antiterminator [Bacteroidetes bacterium]|nr:UpxY family transcription antiterminator [Bacteroidota bacterium]
MGYNWYALYTFPRFEKKVYSRLIERRIEAYLPLQKKLRQWKDRKKWIEEPLIRSYVFVKASELEYYDILNIEGAVRYISFSGKAAAIPEWQIEAMQKLMETDHEITISSKKFNPGCAIRIMSGILAGFDGELITYMGKKRVVIRINQIGHSLVVTLPLSDLEMKDAVKKP